MSTDYCVYLMMRKYGLIILWTASLLLAATGCVQPVEIAPPAEREVFVKCVLEKGKDTQRAVLLYSGGIGEEDFKPVENATLVVNGPVKSYSRNKDYGFHHIGNGVYEVPLDPVDGAEYRLKVAIPGRDTLEATTRMPSAFTISVDFNPPEVWFQNEFVLFPYGDEMTYYWVDPWVNPWIPYSKDAYDRFKKEGRGLLCVEMPGMIFQLDSLDNRHLYILGRIEDSTGVISPIRELATNHMLADNVNANARSYQVEDEPAVPDTARRPRYERAIHRYYRGLPLHDAYLRIDCPADFDNGLRDIVLLFDEYDAHFIEASRYFTIVGSFEYNIWGSYDPDKAHPVLYFCSVSEEYDRYLQSVQGSLVAAEGDLLSSLYGVAGGYSNIRGGYGVFGAVSALRHNCDLKRGVWDFRFCFVPYSPYPAPLPEL